MKIDFYCQVSAPKGTPAAPVAPNAEAGQGGQISFGHLWDFQFQLIFYAGASSSMLWFCRQRPNTLP